MQSGNGKIECMNERGTALSRISKETFNPTLIFKRRDRKSLGKKCKCKSSYENLIPFIKLAHV